MITTQVGTSSALSEQSDADQRERRVGLIDHQKLSAAALGIAQRSVLRRVLQHFSHSSSFPFLTRSASSVRPPSYSVAIQATCNKEAWHCEQ